MTSAHHDRFHFSCQFLASYSWFSKRQRPSQTLHVYSRSVCVGLFFILMLFCSLRACVLCSCFTSCGILCLAVIFYMCVQECSDPLLFSSWCVLWRCFIFSLFFPSLWHHLVVFSIVEFIALLFSFPLCGIIL